MYDPSIGRWLEEDPIGFDAGDADLYRYVGNDSTNATDPSGEEANLWNLFWNTGVAFITGEEPPAEFRIIASVSNVLMEKSILPDITQLYKTPARTFWEWVASHEMEAKNRKFAGLLLRHSLQNSPSKLVFPENHFGTTAIRNSKAYKDAITKIVKNAKPGKSEGVLDGVDFRGIPDLDVAIGHGNFRYKLNKVDDNNYEIEVQVYDRYNFEVHIKPYYDYGSGIYDSFLKATGNNAAWASQWYMVINGFDWETAWMKEKKGNVK